MQVRYERLKQLKDTGPLLSAPVGQRTARGRPRSAQEKADIAVHPYDKILHQWEARERKDEHREYTEGHEAPRKRGRKQSQPHQGQEFSRPLPSVETRPLHQSRASRRGQPFHENQSPLHSQPLPQSRSLRRSQIRLEQGSRDMAMHISAQGRQVAHGDMSHIHSDPLGEARTAQGLQGWTHKQSQAEPKQQRGKPQETSQLQQLQLQVSHKERRHQPLGSRQPSDAPVRLDRPAEPGPRQQALELEPGLQRHSQEQKSSQQDDPRQIDPVASQQRTRESSSDRESKSGRGSLQQLDPDDSFESIWAEGAWH